ncbi:glycosyltransferase [Alkalihalobacillus oceani]|uniref:glycosyltransferase family protein n=1 Tax=Halalkalibacter oceani TaxID=1653776 RepID=UPI00203F7A09|nr:glycosyltransferase [Halalkalibacter oceani]MCM3761872.1 glycosyltransferase [Halalkalibacter oceani]
MRIVHAPTEIAGQMGVLCDELKRRGHEVNGYNWFHTYINYKNSVVHTDAYELARHLVPLAKNSDVFHFHNGNTFSVEGLELPALKLQNKKMVMHHWGNDVRTDQAVKRLNPYALPKSYYSDEEIDHRLKRLSTYIDTAIVQDYEMVPYVKDYYKSVHVVPLACKVDSFVPRYPRVDQSNPLIVHAPTSREFKGTVYVQAGIEQLKGRQLPFRYQPVENMSHEQALATYGEADIIIDQVLCGTYGMLSVEAMALGKVVVAYIRDDVRAQLPSNFPIVSTAPEKVADTLEELLRNPQLRNEIGQKSRRFVEEFHDVRLIAEILEKIYLK